MRLDDSVRLVFNNVIFEGLTPEGVFMSDIAEVGIAAFSQKQKGSHILRLYLIRKKNAEYIVSHELEAYSLASRKGLTKLLNDLPTMSAMDYIIMVNQPNPQYN